MRRKPCRECPWVNKNRHSLNFRKYVDKMKDIGVEKHGCHMITSDIWGYKSEINKNNLCVGHTENNKSDK